MINVYLPSIICIEFAGYVHFALIKPTHTNTHTHPSTHAQSYSLISRLLLLLIPLFIQLVIFPFRSVERGQREQTDSMVDMITRNDLNLFKVSLVIENGMT